jgi:hypothetical protein
MKPTRLSFHYGRFLKTFKTNKMNKTLVNTDANGATKNVKDIVCREFA